MGGWPVSTNTGGETRLLTEKSFKKRKLDTEILKISASLTVESRRQLRNLLRVEGVKKASDRQCRKYVCMGMCV